MRTALSTLIRFYQKHLRAGGTTCRFVPTCSDYSLEAIERFGVIKGGVLATKRILRCHPLGGVGFDPLPKT